MITEVFAELISLAERLGVAKINEMPGCWEHELADDWRVAVNGHGEPMSCGLPFAQGVSVPPFSALFINPKYFGAMAIVSAHGGTTVGGDTETAIIEAIKKTVRGPARGER